eukprot:2171049-Alexandrium_andersonii.AAC.1
MAQDGFEVDRVGAEQEVATMQLKRVAPNAQIKYLWPLRESLSVELGAAMEQHARLLRAAE